MENSHLSDISTNMPRVQDFLFSSYEELDIFVQQLEDEEGVKFVKKRSKQNKVTELKSLEKEKVFIKDKSELSPKLNDGCPFVLIDTENRECMFGPMRQNRKMKKHKDHDFSKSRMIIQDSKKKGCTSRMIIKTIIKFSEYKVLNIASKSARSRIIGKLRNEFSPQTVQELYVMLRMIGNHDNHVTGEEADFSQPVDQEVIGYIHSLIEDGIQSVNDVESRVGEFSRSRSNRSSNQRYNPSRKQIYNIMYNKKNKIGYIKDELVSLGLYVEDIKETNSADNVFFRPPSNPEDGEDVVSFLFVQQTSFQRRILEKYNDGVVLLDSTYNTSRYALPLYMMAVQTGVGFVVVGSFIIGRDTKAQIIEGIKVIKSWTPSWNTLTFLTDYDLREIHAIEEVFRGAHVYLCKFHVKQAWKRRINGEKSMSVKDKEIIMERLNAISACQSEEEYTLLVTELKQIPQYQQNTKLQSWLENRWFSEYKRWVNFSREKMVIRLDTTNGIERQHGILKKNFLKKCGFGGGIVNAIKILHNFFKSMELRYKENNVKARNEAKTYSKNVPSFLINKPPRFIKHCLSRMEPKVEHIPVSNICLTNKVNGTVKSVDSDAVYKVSFLNMIPYCSCQDFSRCHWPCKHLLAISSQFPEYKWEQLDSSYTGQACFNLDALDSTDEHIQLETFFEPAMETCTQEKSAKQIRHECLFHLKEITNSLYCIDDEYTLQEAEQMLLNLKRFTNEKQPSVGSLPVRLTKRKRQKERQRKAKNKTDPFHTSELYEGAKCVPMDTVIVLPANETDNRAVLQNIWTSPGSDETLLQIGPYNLTRNSFLYLKTTLSDEMIDAYLAILVKGTNTLHINCVIATSIFLGRTDVHGHLRNINFNQYDLCLCAVNEGGVHWVLVIILPKEKILYYVNPLGELEDSSQLILQHWYEFLSARRELGFDVEPSGWDVRTMEHSKQTDGYSCGVYVLKFAEMYVRNMPMTFSFTSQDIMEERMRIGEKLLSAATNYLESRKRAVECPNQTSEMCPSPYPCSSGYEMTEESTPNTDNLGGRLTEQFNQSSEETTNTAFASQKTANSIETIPVASYELRKDRKRLKRESFLYFTSPKRSKREKYCVCDKPDDGRVYWMCDVCSNWYHPSCIGLKEEEVPDTFVCKSCLEIETGIMEHSGLTDGDAITGFGKEDESHSTRISDDYIFSKYECVKQYIDDIMTCDSNDCDEYTHRRHHMFINNNKAFCTTSRKKYSYGSKYFHSNSTDKLLERLTKDYILSLHDPCRPATGLKISMLKGVPENSGLYKIFAEKKIIVPVYIVHVLAKEIACYILSEHSKFSIKEADKKCTSTEVELKEVVRASKNF